jgi:hypothetical protein
MCAKYAPLVVALSLALGPRPARAALRVGQIFVRGPTAKAVATAVEAYLRGLSSAATEGRLGRRLLVIEGGGGGPGAWHLVLDSVSGGVDPRLAVRLSGLEGAEALRVEVDGGSLSWLRARAPGRALDAPLRTPARGYEGAPVDGPMPRYRDAELEAFRWLVSAGVEPGLALLSLGEVRPAEGGAGRRAIALEVAPGQAPELREVRVVLPPAPRGGPRVHPDTRLPPGVGPPGLRVDVLRLTGEPVPERVRRLAVVLLAIERRARETLGEPACHLATGRYRRPVYRAMARRRGPCRAVYRRLLQRLDTPPAGDGALHLRLPEAQGE